jgi:hypothetical protein
MFAPPVVSGPTSKQARLRPPPVDGQASLSQRNVGNQAVLRRLSRRAPDPTEDEPGGQAEGAPGPAGPTTPCPASAPVLRGVLQAKLAIGRVDDPLEHEADRIADQVMRMASLAPNVTAASPRVSRRCAACEDEARTLRRKPGTGPAVDLPAIVDAVLGSPGQPLDAAAAADLGARFGRNFSAVRIHADSRAAVDAEAYTVGSHTYSYADFALELYALPV